jgi:hypothetical protein
VNDPNCYSLGCLSQSNGTTHSAIASAHGDMTKVVRHHMPIVIANRQGAREWVKVNDHIARLGAVTDVG